MSGGFNRGLARLIAGQVCIHAAMAGVRMAAPLLALRAGYSEASVGVLLALFALTLVLLACSALGAEHASRKCKEVCETTDH